MIALLANSKRLGIMSVAAAAKRQARSFQVGSLVELADGTLSLLSRRESTRVDPIRFERLDTSSFVRALVRSLSYSHSHRSSFRFAH